MENDQKSPDQIEAEKVATDAIAKAAADTAALASAKEAADACAKADAQEAARDDGSALGGTGAVR